MLDAALRDSLSVEAAAPRPALVLGAADCRAQRSWLGLSTGWGLSSTAWLAGQRQACVRLWRLNGLCLPPYRPSRKIRSGAKLDGLALRRNDVWAWDFVHDRYHDTQPLRCLTVKDEATGYCLAIKTDRHLQHTHVKALLRELVTRYGRPRAIRSDNGSELLAQALREEMKRHNIRLANIEPGKPWQNGSNESFNGTFRKECLNAEIFVSLTEARVVIEQWRLRYNERRPHSSQNYITPAMAYFGLTEMRKA